MRKDVRLLLVGDGKLRYFLHFLYLYLYFIFIFVIFINFNLYFSISIFIEGVGKSTIITSLLTEAFTENVTI